MPLWPFARRRNASIAPLDPQSAYVLWAGSYPPRPHNALMRLEQETVLALLPDLDGKTVLDAGCGTGRYLGALQAVGARPIGLDLSAAMLDRARALSPRVARGSICALPLDSMSVDVIVCGLALGDVPDLELALAEMARVLRPGGCLVYSVVHPVGARAGWSRTFDAGGRRMAIDGYWHSPDEHRQAAAAAGLAIAAWQEPVLPEAPEHPAVLVVRASR
jgi:malonyl-CoA O-methyltransferase